MAVACGDAVSPAVTVSVNVAVKSAGRVRDGTSVTVAVGGRVAVRGSSSDADCVMRSSKLSVRVKLSVGAGVGVEVMAAVRVNGSSDRVSAAVTLCVRLAAADTDRVGVGLWYRSAVRVEVRSTSGEAVMLAVVEVVTLAVSDSMAVRVAVPGRLRLGVSVRLGVPVPVTSPVRVGR